MDITATCSEVSTTPLFPSRIFSIKTTCLHKKIIFGIILGDPEARANPTCGFFSLRADGEGKARLKKSFEALGDIFITSEIALHKHFFFFSSKRAARTGCSSAADLSPEAPRGEENSPPPKGTSRKSQRVFWEHPENELSCPERSLLVFCFSHTGFSQDGESKGHFCTSVLSADTETEASFSLFHECCESQGKGFQLHHSSLRDESGMDLELSVHSGLSRVIMMRSDLTGDVSGAIIMKSPPLTCSGFSP